MVYGRIIDRMVVKDAHYSKPEDRHLWTYHLTWAGDLGDLVNRKPMEVEVMDRLQAAQADCILRLRGKWRVFEDKIMHKAYTGWCPYKTLQHLIDEETEEDSPVNEPLAWWISKNLVDMACSWSREVSILLCLDGSRSSTPTSNRTTSSSRTAQVMAMPGYRCIFSPSLATSAWR